jgi:hypothetical protein
VRVLLDDDLGDHDALPDAQGGAVLLEALGDLARVERRAVLRVDVDAAAGGGHVEAHGHGAPLERAAQRGLVLGGGGRGGAGRRARRAVRVMSHAPRCRARGGRAWVGQPKGIRQDYRIVQD